MDSWPPRRYQLRMRAVLLLHFGSTLFMAGAIWIVQVVHYPLFAGVGEEGFVRYATEHARLISFVVMPAMLVELGTAVILTQHPELTRGTALAYLGLALIVLIWASTFFLQVPQHGRLQGGFVADAHRTLVLGNWLRTGLWTARSALVLYWMAAWLPKD